MTGQGGGRGDVDAPPVGRERVPVSAGHTATSDVERTAGLPLVEYYAESGNPPGRWLGGGLAGLGEGQGIPVGAEVSEAAMTAVFGHAADPVTGAALGRPFLTRTGVDGVAAPVGGGGL